MQSTNTQTAAAGDPATSQDPPGALGPDRAALESLAREVFATHEAAQAWLQRWHPSLNASPEHAARTPEGVKQVHMILNAIKFGINV